MIPEITIIKHKPNDIDINGEVMVGFTIGGKWYGDYFMVKTLEELNDPATEKRVRQQAQQFFNNF